MSTSIDFEGNAWLDAGYRERFAMLYGVKEVVYINGNKCYKYTFDRNAEYQDANGATYDTIRKRWIA